ncbi:MAG TPA: hypothetical protein VF903_04855 [Nitrospirota bacterium]
MPKQNCWEVKKCGREPGGARNDLGTCAAALEHRLHGAHGGKHAGRACWVVAGTLCGGVPQGSFAQKFGNCEKCDFYQLVKKEERAGFTLSVLLLQKLKTVPDQKKNSVSTALSSV